MGQVSVLVNGRNFTITCDDGQEARTRRLAQYVDTKVGQFAASVGQVGEAKLLLLAALAIAENWPTRTRRASRSETGQAPHLRRASRSEIGQAPNLRRSMARQSRTRLLQPA